MKPEPVDVLLIADGDVRTEAVALIRRVVEVCAVAEVAGAEFDDATDRWRVQTRSGAGLRPRVIVAEPASGIGIDDMVPYLGVVQTGRPNLFRLSGPDVARQADYIGHCLSMMDVAEATRIVVRAGVQRAGVQRAAGQRTSGPVSARARRRYLHAMRHPDPADFDLSSVDEREPDAVYSGTAVLSSGALRQKVHVDLNGHFEPLDGKYHWYGRVHGDIDEFKRPTGAAIVLAIDGESSATAALEERDPWGNYRITGVGSPPYRLEPIRL